MFQNMKLGSKMVLGFALVLLLSTAVTMVGIVYMRGIADTIDTLYDHPYTAHTSAVNAQAKIIAMARVMKDLILAGDQDARDAFIEELDALEQEVMQEFDTLYASFLGDHALIDEALASFHDWAPIREDVILYLQLGMDQLAGQISTTRGTPQIHLVEANIQKVVDDAALRAENFKDEARQSADSATSTVMGLLAIAYVVAVVAAIGITRSVTKPVSLLLSFTREVARGNLSVPDVAYKGKDEIAVLTAALNGMKADLREMVTAVMDSVRVVHSSAEEMTAGAEESSASVEELASTANEFAGAVDRLSSNTQDMADLAGKTNELARQGSSDIEQTIKSMAEINTVVTELAAEVKELGIHSEEIGRIVALITGIADQTNLLALNAAIEAARAGEQGRGFAVVAEEVRQLAEQSGQAAGEITKLVQQIRDAVNSSVDQTEIGTAKVTEGMDIVSRTGKRFAEIAEIIQSLTSGINDIAAASEELAAGAEEIGATTQQQSASAQQMAATAVEVAQAADTVEEHMKRFQL